MGDYSHISGLLPFVTSNLQFLCFEDRCTLAVHLLPRFICDERYIQHSIVKYIALHVKQIFTSIVVTPSQIGLGSRDSQVKMTLMLLEDVLAVRKEALAADRSVILALQHELVRVCFKDEQVRRNVVLLEEGLKANHLDR
jgi:hypothetical protein